MAPTPSSRARTLLAPLARHWTRWGLALIASVGTMVGCGGEDVTGMGGDYLLSLTPAALTVVQGADGNTDVTLTRTDFTGAVTLSLGGAPAGVTGAFAPPAPTGTSSTLTVSVGAAVAPGVYNLTVDGTGTPGSRSTPLTLTVQSSVPTVSFTAAAQSVAEGVGTATITAQLSQTSTLPVTVPFTMGGTAANPADYTVTTSPITIPAGNTSGTITVTVVADGVAEPDETVIATMGVPTNATLGATTVHTLTITAQPPTVIFTAAAQSVAEGVGTATITAQLSQPSTLPVTLPFTVGGTAATPADFTITLSPITIAAGNTSATITVTVVADAIAEPNETVIVTLGAPTNAVLGATTAHTLTITAQPLPTVTFTTATQTTNEGAAGTITAQLSGASSQVVTVPFTLGGTATNPADYTITASPITIAAGNTTGTITVTVAADGVAELGETVVVTMGAPTNATQGATTVHTLTIAAQPAPTVSFTAAAQSVAEGVGAATITAQLSSPSSQAVTVPFTVGGTAANPADYTITASPITIAAGNTTGTATVTIVADGVAEPDETVIVTMGAPTNATLGATTVHTLTITAQVPSVSFTAAAQSVAEGVGTATITAQLSQASTQTVTVPFTVGGTATNPADYTVTASPITITAGNTTGTITVTVVADGVAEPNETVIATMGAPTNATLGATSVHTLTITGQTPTVSFTAAAQSVAEGVGTATITAQLSSPSSQTVTVPFTVSGTAANPADYTITASPVTITAGNTTGTVTVTVVADGVAEADETVIVTMGTPTNAAQGATTVHTLTITGTLPSVSFTAAAQSVGEGVGTATITAQLSSPSSQTVTVPFTVGGTAANPADYTITASPVTITAGNTTGTITVTVVADGVAEPDETVIVTMGTPTNAGQGATTVHTLTITAQVPTVSFTAAVQSVAEGVGTATITAQLSQASTQAVTVPFTVGGTAANPADYTITASPVSIAAGNTTGTITVTVVADAVAEPNETVIVTMGAPTNATQGATTVHTLTITGQTPTVSFTAAAQSVAEGVGTATITAQLSQASTQTVTVPFTVGGTAANPADYTITASPVTITAGNTTGTITVTVVADGAAEPDETVIVTMGAPTNATLGATTVHTLTVLASGGGSGNVTVDFSACPVAERPLWLAAQDGAGAWNTITGVGNVYQFNITSGRGGMAYVLVNTGDTTTTVQYMTQAEFTAGPIVFCGIVPAGKTISGTAAGITALDFTTISLGGGLALPNTGFPNFQITGVANGTHDLVGFRRSLIGAAEAAIIRRDQNIADGGSVGTMDFNGVEAFVPATALITVGGLGGGETIIAGMSYQVGASCTAATLSSGLIGGATFTASGIPGAQQRASDFHGISISASLGSGALRSTTEYFHTLGARTVTLGAAMPAPGITIAGRAVHPAAGVLHASGRLQHVHGVPLRRRGEQVGEPQRDLRLPWRYGHDACARRLLRAGRVEQQLGAGHCEHRSMERLWHWAEFRRLGVRRERQRQDGVDDRVLLAELARQSPRPARCRTGAFPGCVFALPPSGRRHRQRRQLSRLEHRVERCHLGGHPGVELSRHVAEFLADRRGPGDLRLRRTALIAVHAPVEPQQVFAQPLLAGDHPAFPGRDDFHAHPVHLR